MILVDSSVWIAHLRHGDSDLAQLLDSGLILGHPWVTGELVLGQLTQRSEVIGLLSGLEQATVATPGEIMTLVERHRLFGVGIGYVDAQLLAATQLTMGAKLWTKDRPLNLAASRLGCAAGA